MIHDASLSVATLSSPA